MKKVTITMDSGATMEGELYPEIAPITSDNFETLANKGFYDGLTFHRVIPGFMIQGGCPKGDGTGGPGYQIVGEFSGNGIENKLLHQRGVLSMARANNPNSGGCQFFIMVEDAPFLDGQYAAFGRITTGLDEADRIVGVSRDFSDKPKQKQTIKSIRVSDE